MPSPLNPHPNAHPSAGAYTNAAQIAVSINRVGVAAAVRATSKTRHFAMLLETRVKANASGRPGPNAPTGDYRRSWTSDVAHVGGDIVGTVGTNRPQARRLEFGFVGEDRLGRVFNQRPYPHLGPAVSLIGPQYAEGLESLGDWAD
jgi:hypothetical protein